MAEREEISGVYEFGPFRLDAKRRLLWRDDAPVQLTPRVFDTLRVLVEHGRNGVSKDDLMREVWGETIVEETNLTTNISLLRKALGERRDEHSYIVTLPGEGYRFVAEVYQAPAGQVPVVIHERTRTAVTIEEEEEERSDEPVFRSREDRLRLPKPRRLFRKWFYGAGACVLIVGAIGYFFWSRRKTAIPPARISSIAILPFKPLVATNRDEALEVGIADTLITRLSSLHETVVRPLSAVRRYSEPEQDALAAGRALKVEAVLDGEIARSGDRVRVTARLLRVADGRQLWDGTFDESFTDIFAVQDRVSDRVVTVLATRLSGTEERQLRKRYTANAEAYRLYLTGRYLWGKRTGEAYRLSIARFQEALKLDPNYALAYAGLADSYNFLGSAGEMPMSQSHPLAKAAAERALELDDQLAEAHTSLAANIMDYYWDWSAAERHFQRALDLNPNYATAHHLYSQYLSIMGRMGESVAEAEKAHELDPLSLAETENVALALYRARRYDETIALSRQVLQMDENFVPARIQLGLSYVQQGKRDESIAELQRALDLSGHNPDILGMIGFANAAAGRRVEAQATLAELKRLSKKQYVSPFDIAGVLIGLGENDEAFKWLDKALAERVWIMGFIKVEPVFDGLRSDERYLSLVRRIGLTQ